MAQTQHNLVNKQSKSTSACFTIKCITDPKLDRFWSAFGVALGIDLETTLNPKWFHRVVRYFLPLDEGSGPPAAAPADAVHTPPTDHPPQLQLCSGKAPRLSTEQLWSATVICSSELAHMPGRWIFPVVHLLLTDASNHLPDHLYNRIWGTKTTDTLPYML